MNNALQVNPKDNVITCLCAVSKGTTLDVAGQKITAAADIPVFHKMAITAIPAGGLCYKYGEIIGDALENINPGDHVHVHNIESTRGRGDKQKG